MIVKPLKNVVKKIVLCLTIILLNSCSKERMYEESINVDNINTVKSTNINTKGQEAILNDNSITVIPKNLKIIKTASVKYKVKDIKKATKRIKEIALRHNGYIADLHFENNLYTKENNFTIKIPQQYFDVSLDTINSFVTFIDYENITTKDVTEEYVDLQTRLKTKLEIKERYEVILRKRAKTVEDILLTEDKLRILQEEIEAAQGRLKYLSSKVSYSTIEVILYETVTYKEEPVAYKKTIGNKIINAFSFGYKFIETIFIGILHIWPLLLIAILLFIFYKKKPKKSQV